MTAHRDKIRELLENVKVPDTDRARVASHLVPKYDAWIASMDQASGEGEALVRSLVQSLNEYKRFVEVDFVWDSESDFLFRQRGQLKLDGSIIEEFLPRLADPRILPNLKDIKYETGPRTAFAATYFMTSLTSPSVGGGLTVRTKDQDFTIGRTAYLRSSLEPTFAPSESSTQQIYLAFVAAECKTNLDKTMFQEATATAHDLKTAIVGSRYYLLCEWLDMTPISTAATDIDQVIILRGKRINSNVRRDFAASTGCIAGRNWYLKYLEENPIRPERVLHFTRLLNAAFEARAEGEDEVLTRGFF